MPGNIRNRSAFHQKTQTQRNEALLSINGIITRFFRFADTVQQKFRKMLHPRDAAFPGGISSPVLPASSRHAPN
jgi:hypothetical protein